jgi:hypothetical protein
MFVIIFETDGGGEGVEAGDKGEGDGCGHVD